MLSRGRRLVQYAHSLWGKAWEILGKALAKNRRGYSYHAVIQQQPSPRAERLAISYNKSLTAEKSKSQKTRLSDYLSIYSPPPYTLCAYELHGRFPPIYLCYPSYQNKNGSLVWVYVWMETRMGLPFPFSIFRPYKTALREGEERRRRRRKNFLEQRNQAPVDLPFVLFPLVIATWNDKKENLKWTCFPSHDDFSSFFRTPSF